MSVGFLLCDDLFLKMLPQVKVDDCIWSENPAFDFFSSQTTTEIWNWLSRAQSTPGFTVSFFRPDFCCTCKVFKGALRQLSPGACQRVWIASITGSNLFPLYPLVLPWVVVFFVSLGNKATISFSSHEDANNAFWNSSGNLKASAFTIFCRRSGTTPSETRRSDGYRERSTPGRSSDKKWSERKQMRRHDTRNNDIDDDVENSRSHHRRKRRIVL